MMTQTGSGLSMSAEEILSCYQLQQQFFERGATRPLAFRKAMLRALKAAVKKNEALLIAAMHKDLRKSEFEAYGTEIGLVYEEINEAIRQLDHWAAPRRVKTPLLFFPSKSYILPQPLGITLHISPWNYPFLLLFCSLISAMAAGNTCVLKPSEMAPATEAAIKKLIDETFNPEYIAVITGPGKLITTELIERFHFGHIFFTGSMAVGKKIMEAASKHLSPVTLELGGKSPCVVCADARLEYAAKKIVWSKFINAGQTCVAPDYLLVHASVKDRLLPLLKKEITGMFGEDPLQSADYPRIISRQRAEVLVSYLQQGELVHGGGFNIEEKYIAPTILDEVEQDAAVMREEIFGPILPVVVFNSNEEAAGIIARNPYPLAMYVYTQSRKQEKFFTEQIPFGGGCINNGLVHLGVPSLPFGGVGYSGMGRYHGVHGFYTFSHQKAIVKSPAWFDVPVWYAPFKKAYVKIIRWLMK